MSLFSRSIGPSPLLSLTVVGRLVPILQRNEAEWRPAFTMSSPSASTSPNVTCLSLMSPVSVDNRSIRACSSLCGPRKFSDHLITGGKSNLICALDQPPRCEIGAATNFSHPATTALNIHAGFCVCSHLATGGILPYMQDFHRR